MDNILEKPSVHPDVVKRAQSGDTNAFAEIFNAHKSLVYSRCLRMTNNISEAEDLTQDAFMQVFRKISSFRGDSALSTWLYRIAINTVLMHFRKKTLRATSLELTQRDSDGNMTAREFGVNDGRLTGSTDRLSLARAIKELPEGYRQIFMLHEVQGYEHSEIAKMLGCSTGNSKSQLHKAKLRIRKFLLRTDPSEAIVKPRGRKRRMPVPLVSSRPAGLLANGLGSAA